MGNKVPLKYFNGETMVDVLNNPVDSTGQFVMLIQLLQMSEVTGILIVPEGVLYISCNGTVDVFIRSYLRREGRAGIIVYSSNTHRTTIADIFFYSFHSQNVFKFPVRNECRVQKLASVIQLVICGKQESQ